MSISVDELDVVQYRSVASSVRLSKCFLSLFIFSYRLSPKCGVVGWWGFILHIFVLSLGLFPRSFLTRPEVDKLQRQKWQERVNPSILYTWKVQYQGHFRVCSRVEEWESTVTYR